jgi:hypothetical protein
MSVRQNVFRQNVFRQNVRPPFVHLAKHSHPQRACPCMNGTGHWLRCTCRVEHCCTFATVTKSGKLRQVFLFQFLTWTSIDYLCQIANVVTKIYIVPMIS